MKKCKECPFLEYKAPVGKERRPYYCKLFRIRQFYTSECRHNTALIDKTIELYNYTLEKGETVDYGEMADFIYLYGQGNGGQRRTKKAAGPVQIQSK